MKDSIQVIGKVGFSVFAAWPILGTTCHDIWPHLRWFLPFFSESIFYEFLNFIGVQYQIENPFKVSHKQQQAKKKLESDMHTLS